MKILSRETKTLTVLSHVEYVWDAATRKNVPVAHRMQVEAVCTRAEAIGIWAQRSRPDTHLMTVGYAEFVNPDSTGKGYNAHGKTGKTVRTGYGSDASHCRQHTVGARFFSEVLDPHDKEVQDRYVTCEDCRHLLGLEMVKDVRHFIPLIERPVRPPTQKEIKAEKFRAKFAEKYGEDAERHFDSFQNTNSNARLWQLKNLLERPFAWKHPLESTMPGEKRVTALMREAGRAADLGGNEALDRHVADLLGYDLRWGENGKNPRHADHYYLNGETRVLSLSAFMSNDEVCALLEIALTAPERWALAQAAGVGA